MGEDRLDALDAKLDAIIESQSKVETLVTTILAEVKPTLDALMKSPMLKMLGIGRKG